MFLGTGKKQDTQEPSLCVGVGRKGDEREDYGVS